MTTFPQRSWRKSHSCRLCGMPNPRTVLELQPTPPANAFCCTAEEARAQEKIPLYLAKCASCGHVQLPIVVDPEVLFRDYVYVSGTSPAFVEHFRQYARDVGAAMHLGKNDLVVDVGSNDGTLLLQFNDLFACQVLGIDPAERIASMATDGGIPTMPTYFTRALAREIKEQHGPATLVTANNVFAHADDLAEIALAARDLLYPERGRFVFEVQYLVDLVEGGLFDMVYHEHLSYHHVAPLLPFFNKLGMSLVDVERVPTHGGSIRCAVASLGGIMPSVRVRDLIAAEKEALANPWHDLAEKITDADYELCSFLVEERGRVVVGYGAPAKLTTLCHRFGITGDHIARIVDDSPWKRGLYAPGTGIPVVGQEGLVGADTVIIFAWNFAPQIAAKLRASGFTGRIVRPLPTLEDL